MKIEIIILGVLGGGPVTGMGDFEKGPCVGVCYYIKKRGIKIDSSMKVWYGSKLNNFQGIEFEYFTYSLQHC